MDDSTGPSVYADGSAARHGRRCHSFGLGHFVFFSGVGSAFSVGSKWEPSRRYISATMNAASNPDLLRKIMVSRLGPRTNPPTSSYLRTIPTEFFGLSNFWTYLMDHCPPPQSSWRQIRLMAPNRQAPMVVSIKSRKVGPVVDL